MSSIHYFLSPEFTSFVHEKAKVYGPITSGALFGAGWWFWVDGVVGSSAAPFVQWLPGIVATLALIMINSVRR